MLIISPENYFLIAIGIIWIFFAVLQDLKRREVDNLWNFSLIAFALAYRLAFSGYSGNYWFFINGILGLAIFLFLGNLFYYSRLFAGGDAKLVIALGTILPLSYNWITNFKIFGLFILLFLILGSIYSLIWAVVLVLENFRDFRKQIILQWKKHTILFWIVIIVAVVSSLLIYYASGSTSLSILFGIVLILFPILFVFAKAVEESGLKKWISPQKLTEGEWLYHDINVAGRKIKASWDGISADELSLIKRKYKKDVLIKEGIPFTPSFLLAFICLLILFWSFGVWF
jgi:Flp pilus assembly protein protease CpaA